ncbi:MAG: recombinase family protein [Candidatus Nealsonbacteria bacterium]|nr:recombinase family protein [Candidatus Nealsonbacteria bacterium]
MEKQKVITYFLYCRKSTDEKDRQVLSLGSQESEAVQRFGNLKIIKLPHESVSAFEPDKRPVFKSMVERIKNGEAQGIIAWHPDRLSRNPKDGAEIIYLIDIGKIKDLKFCSYYFDNSPEGKMMLQITLSQSKYSSDKLSKDVKRGMDKKALSGWRPGLATFGYINSKINFKGEQVIYNDSLRFHRVKQMWQMLLTGNYTIPKIFDVVNDEWKMTMPATRKRSERKMQLSCLYKIFTNPFYYGWYEYPIGSDNWIHGKHEPMITEDEFNRAQFILGRKGKPKPHTHKFAFTGLMRCGSCGAMITAEEKFKKQNNGNVHHYIYYHCTKKINPDCAEKSIELKNFSKQVDGIISKLTISEKFKDWAIRYLHEINKNEAMANEETVLAKHKRYEGIIKQTDGLLLKYTSPENSDGQIMTNEEYTRLRSSLLKEKNELETELNNTGKKIEEWLEFSEKTFNLARYARMWFANGDLDTKRAIFACLGSHLVLKDKKVSIQLKKPFDIIFEGLPNAGKELGRLEPLKIPKNRAKFEEFVSKFPIMSG